MNRNAILSCAVILGYMQQEMEAVGSVEQVDENMNSLLGMEEMENMSFDEVEANPGFVQPPVGVYRIGLHQANIKTRKNKEGKLQRNINHIYKILATEELADSSEKPVADGGLFSERWQMTPEGLGYWKPRVSEIIGEGQTTGMRVTDVVRLLNDGGYTFKAKISHRETKDKDGKTYININIQVIERGQEVPEGAV